MKINPEKFNNQPFKTVKATAGCIVERDGRVLITKRNTSYMRGKWCVPGGHIDIGESAENCARRETKEETGLDVKDLKFFNYYDEFFPDNKFHAVVLIFSASAVGKEKMNEEVSEMRWISEKELNDFDFLFRVKEILQDYFRRKK